jgi:hypothetical protein
VEGQIQAADLVVLAHPQADERVDELEDGQREDPAIPRR